jgi:hypothetical protein
MHVRGIAATKTVQCGYCALSTCERSMNQLHTIYYDLYQELLPIKDRVVCVMLLLFILAVKC